MGSVIIALPKREDAQHISDLLRRRGLEVALVCTAASKALQEAHRIDCGLVICMRKLSDMHYTELADGLPPYVDMLLLAPKDRMDDVIPGVMALGMPFRPSELVGTVEMLLQQQTRRLRRLGARANRRTQQEQNYINNAKEVLMERNHMTEQEAFRYIQKCSMDSGTNMVETAQMVLLLAYEQ